jgi:hypothetical protein
MGNAQIAKLTILLAFFAAGVHAESPIKEPPPSVLEGAAPAPSRKRLFQFVPQISVVSINALQIPNPGYQVAYLPTLEGLPALHLGVARSIADWGPVNWTLQASLGYGQKSGVFQVTPSGLGPRSERLMMRWFPALISAKFSYRIPTLASISPSLSVGFGNVTLIQSSETPELSRAAAIPVLLLSPQLSFLDLTANSWLGGFSFGATILRGVGGDSSLGAASLDLGITILL